MKGPADPARLDGVGGLPDRDRLRARRSRRVPVAEAPAEYDNQNREETRAKDSNAARSHEPIVAAGETIDKLLVNCAAGGTLVTMRRAVNADWKPTVPALVNLVAASGAPHLRAAFAAAGLDGIRPAQAVALVPLASGGLHASGLADQLRVSRQAVAQAIAALERHSYVTRVPDPVDARARIIELTPRGRQAVRVMRSNAVDLEKRWEHVLGRQRLGELRETLELLLSGEAEAAGN
jgi:DNA-binding MarR family transcriptional regulator